MRTLVVLASLVAATALAAPAQADPGSSLDASFLATLDKADITYHSPAEAVAAGKEVCQMMDQGQARSDVVSTVSASNPGITMSGAAQFTMIAASAYCPQHLNEPATAPQPPPPPSWTWLDFPLPTPGAA